MIDVMQRMATKIYPVRLIFVVLSFVFLFVFIYALVSGDESQDVYLLPSLVSFAWSVCLFGISDVFKSVPQKTDENDGFFRRIKKRVRRFITWMWSIGFFVCSVLLFYLSYKSFGLALAGS